MTRDEANYVLQLERKVKALQEEVDILKKKLSGEPVFETIYHDREYGLSYHLGEYNYD